ncbi:uncharacterized protein LOC134824487 [Bolinopsis microptera]|uniref:uncharacterized protein LOC134824487 n=1 Tax=Bolinopsis microptera TaxID=2820187 RepID=UPI003079AD64
MFMFLIILWMIPSSICVDYQITATIIPGLYSGTADKQFVTIKGKAPVEKECSADFNVDNQDVTCSVQTENAIEDYKCLLWRTDGNDGMDLSKIKVIADNTVIHLIEPPQDATVIAITGANSYVFCHQQPRQREQGEIVPVSAEQSETKGLETVKALFNAELAIDLNHASGCTAVPDGTGVSYVKLNFGKVYCVEKVTWYRDGEIFKTWTCNEEGCSSDNGDGYTLTVYSGGGGDQPRPCQYGDTVKLAREGGRVLSVAEISVIARPDADCTSVDSTWTNVRTDPTLPVTHGVEITLSCPKDYTNKGGDKATCQDGTFVPTGQQPPNCPKCMTVNEDLKITVTDPQLPAEDGASINYRCSKKYAKKGGNVNLVCENGIVTFSGGNTPCFKIGTASLIQLYIIKMREM